MTTLNLATAASADDSRVFTGTWSNTSIVLALGNNNTSGAPAAYNHQNRFTNVNIANPSTINSAVYTWQSLGPNAGTVCNVTLGFEDSDNPSQVSNLADFNARTRTATTISDNGIGTIILDVDYSHPDVKASLQQVVDRAGFASGNAINMIVLDNASSTDAFRQGKSYDSNSSPSVCGRLAIDYTAGSSTPNVSSYMPGIQMPVRPRTRVIAY